MEYLSKEMLVAINQSVIERSVNGHFEMQYSEGLDIIVQQPQQVLFGRELYPTIWLKAAFIVQKITKKHIFQDGNKRTALIATAFFLNMNGYHLEFDLESGKLFILTVTNEPDDEQVMLAAANWLKNHSSKK